MSVPAPAGAKRPPMAGRALAGERGSPAGMGVRVRVMTGPMGSVRQAWSVPSAAMAGLSSCQKPAP